MSPSDWMSDETLLERLAVLQARFEAADEKGRFDQAAASECLAIKAMLQEREAAKPLDGWDGVKRREPREVRPGALGADEFVCIVCGA